MTTDNDDIILLDDGVRYAREIAMIREFEPVVFTVDLPQSGLLAGDMGTVADIHPSGKAYEVEVFLADGSTYDVVTVQEGQIRPATRNEVAHVRAITSAEATI